MVCSCTTKIGGGGGRVVLTKSWENEYSIKFTCHKYSNLGPPLIVGQDVLEHCKINYSR